jgi:DNA-binding transcriptional LysR family regulator
VVGTVRLAGFATALAELVAPAAVSLRASHPRLALIAAEQEAPMCFAALARGDVDVAISMASRQAPAPDDPRFHRAPLMTDTLDAVLPAGHPLAARPELELTELAGETFVGPPDGTSCHDVTITGCAAAGFAPAFTHRTLDFHTTMALVAAGLGVALVPRLGQAVVPPGAIVRPLRDPAPARHVFAATRAGAERRPAIAAVLAALSAGSG